MDSSVRSDGFLDRLRRPGDPVVTDRSQGNPVKPRTRWLVATRFIPSHGVSI